MELNLAKKAVAVLGASNGWYQAFTQDVIDFKAYGKLEMPVLATDSPANRWMDKDVPNKAAYATVVNVEQSGHFVHEEETEVVVRSMLDFLGAE